MQIIFPGIIVPASVLIPIILFLVRCRAAQGPVRTIFYYLLLAGVVNAVAILLAAQNINNLPLLHGYTLAEGLVLLYYFRRVLRKKAFVTAVTMAMPLFAFIVIVNFAFFQSIFVFNTYARPVEALLISGCCLLYILDNSGDEETGLWSDNTLNWINAGLLIYFPAAFVIFAFSNLLLEAGNRAMVNIIWHVHAALVLLMYLLFAAAFRKCRP